MFRTPMIISLICITITIGVCLYTWQNLPDLESYPVHWNASGVTDRHGTKNEVFFNLTIMPLTSLIIALIFYFAPKFEPMRDNLIKSIRAYRIMWIALMFMFTGISIMIAKSYIGISDEQQALASPHFIPLGMSAFFIVIGNLMGKIRQNFIFGIRTPWTLSSDLSWEKTHRITGRLLVGAGLIGIIAALFAPVHIGIMAIAGFALAITAFSFIYSYKIWKSDPDKRK